MNFTSLKQMLEEIASEVPQQTAIVLGSRKVSYRELDETSNKIANALISLGIKKGDHVAILMSRTPDWVINCFGALKAGAAAVPNGPIEVFPLNIQSRQLSPVGQPDLATA